MNYSFNYQCIKTAESFGETAYYNICTGQNYTIPWGSIDWTNAVIGYGIGALFFLAFITIAAVTGYAMYEIEKESRVRYV